MKRNLLKEFLIIIVLIAVAITIGCLVYFNYIVPSAESQKVPQPHSTNINFESPDDLDKASKDLETLQLDDPDEKELEQSSGEF